MLSDTLGLDDDLTPKLIVRVTTSDTVSLEDIDALGMLFSPTINEAFEIVAAYLSPGSSFTSWAMNTRTGAVTEYSNFIFNSFAQMGGKYLAASADGLYELNGPDDDGTDIIARIKSGFAQFAGSRMTLFKGIYLAVRGEGEWVLRLTTGEGQSYDYAVSTRNQRSTKVHHGKGLKARYFAFELISTGQDFELESLEFVPLVTDRRV